MDLSGVEDFHFMQQPLCDISNQYQTVDLKEDLLAWFTTSETDNTQSILEFFFWQAAICRMGHCRWKRQALSTKACLYMFNNCL